MSTLSLLALALAAPLAAPDAPFLDLDLETARARSQSESKVLLIAWMADWDPQSKRMETTWTDTSVQKWLSANTIPIRFEGDKKKKLALEMKINAYPTVILVAPEGAEFDRILGHQGPERFLSLLEASVAGRTGAGEPSGDKANDPMAWLAYANAMFAKRTDAEATLDAYFWCFDNGDRHQPGFRSKYLDFLLKRISVFFNVVGDSKPRLRERRDAIARLLFDATGDADDALTLARTNLVLGDEDETIAAYDRLATGSPEQLALRAILFEEVLIRLVANRRYDDVLASAGNVMERAKRGIAALQPEDEAQAARAEEDADFRSNRSDFLLKTGNLYEALLGRGKGAEAGELADLLTEAFPTGRTYALLINHAGRLEFFDLARSIGAGGKEKLGPKGQKIIDRAVRKLKDNRRRQRAAQKAGEDEEAD